MGPNNEGSRRTILACGGVFERIANEGDKKLERYWITLDSLVADEMRRPPTMVQAVFLDFYGTAVYEDNEPIQSIVEQIFETGIAESKEAIGTFWWKRFSSLCTESFGENFRSQRTLELQSLQETLDRFQSNESALKLCKPQFDYWMSPPIFEESKLFFELCPVPITVVSNIDTGDLVNSLDFHNIRPAEVVTSEQARAYKPRKEIFELALKKSGLLPHEVIHIGDSVTSDVLGAKAAGIHAIWVNRYNKPVPDSVHVAALNLLGALKTGYFVENG